VLLLFKGKKMAVSKVVVVDGNNLIVRIDRGVAGRGITDVEPVEIDNALYLEFTFSDGTTETVGPVGVIQYVGTAPIVVAGANISLSTVPVNLGGTNATTAANARTNLNAANQDTTITAGTGLSGGGSLAANRTINIANTAVTAGAYGSASNTLSATVNAQGQLTALAATPIAVANTQVSGLGTMSTQNANSVAITGGSVTGITDLAVLDGGTGASDASGARTNLGAAASATTITAGTGLSGGGDLSANRTLAIANTAVTAGSFGSASNTLTATVNAQGQLTALAATPIAIANTQVSGLGTASVLNAGVALGVATLDAGGTVPLSQIPASIQGGVSYQGSWNASTNTPTLTSSVGSKGYYYVVSVAGSTNLNGITDWLPGDWAIYNGTAWEKIDNTDTVASVNGYVGAVVLNAADVGAPPTTRSISTGTGLTGGGDLSANRTIAIDSTVATLTGTQTLTNKTINLANNTLQATSAEIAAAVTDETGSGALVFANSPTLVTPALGTPASGVVTNLTGTASININGTVGATTPNTGAFTDLSFSGTGTFSGGTANGVAYLNGSKVLTTGSALTFDGTNFSATGTTTVNSANSSQVALVVKGETGNGIRQNFIGQASSGQYNWQIGASITAAGYFAIIPSTAVDGATFSTAAYSITGTGTSIWAVGGSEQMRLTSTGLGIGTSSPSTRLHTKALGNFFTSQESNTGTSASPYASGISFSNYLNLTRSAIYNLDQSQSDSGGNLGFYTTTSDGTLTERARINSLGNLGIGTSSPTQKLDVAGAIRTSGAPGVGSVYVDVTSSGAAGALTLLRSGAVKRYVGLDASDNFAVIDTGGGSQMVIDSSGNLGLGVTPSAWNTIKPIEIARAGSFVGANSTGSTYLGANTRFASGWIYANTGASGLYTVEDNTHFWRSAPSGTAGDTVTWTQAMTLDASGRLGIGLTSPAQILHLKAANPFIQIERTNGDISYVGTDATGMYVGTGGAIPIYFNTNNTERARIDSSGNLGIGTSSPLTPLYVRKDQAAATYVTVDNVGTVGASTSAGFACAEGGTVQGFFRSLRDGSGQIQLYNAGAYPLVFGTGNTERARIDSSGNLLVGTTSALDVAMFTAVAPASRRGMSAKTVTSAFAVLQLWNADTTGDNGFVDFYTEAGQSVRGSITYNRAGGLVAYNVTSDYRAKDINGPVTGSGALIDSVPVYMGKMKGATQERPMFIAHEVPAYAHTGVKDAVDADGNPVYQQMDASALIPVMWAEIQSLRARLAAANI
jgi:hypothetical protein